MTQLKLCSACHEEKPRCSAFARFDTLCHPCRASKQKRTATQRTLISRLTAYERTLLRRHQAGVEPGQLALRLSADKALSHLRRFKAMGIELELPSFAVQKSRKVEPRNYHAGAKGDRGRVLA